MYVKKGFSLSLIWNDPTYVYHNLFQILDFILNFYYVIEYIIDLCIDLKETLVSDIKRIYIQNLILYYKFKLNFIYQILTKKK